MTEEDKDLLIKDLCARLPYKPQVEIIKDGTSITDKLTTATINHLEGGYWDVKPYLFPLTNITEEQYYEMNICASEDCVEHFDILRSIQEHTEFSKWPLYEYRVIDFFHKNHFDYRCLIEKGLAIDATGLNIY
jgi:hypothetical protein